MSVMEKRRHQRKLLSYSGLDTINISLMKSISKRPLARRSYLWDLSCSGGSVCADKGFCLEVGEVVALRAHDHINASEYVFNARVRWVSEFKFGFEFVEFHDLRLLEDHLDEKCF